MRQQILEAEVAALRAEIKRMNAPPMPALGYGGRDAYAMIATIRARGLHPSEAAVVADMMEDLADELDKTHEDLKAARS